MKPKPITIRPTLPGVALQRAYLKKLDALVKKMSRSVSYWITAEYRRQEPEITQDVLPSRALADRLAKVMKKWRREFNDGAEEVAKWFVNASSRHVNNSIRTALREAGFTVKARMTRAERDVLSSLIIENVNLIKSIPEQYFTQVQSLVQVAVQNGRDLGYLSEELENRYDITHRRAVVIARDQTNKATEQMSVARNKALGITQGLWIHTSGGKTYRKTHVEMNGKLFDLDKGLYDSAVGHYIMPGEEINCRCTYRPVLSSMLPAGFEFNDDGQERS